MAKSPTTSSWVSTTCGITATCAPTRDVGGQRPRRPAAPMPGPTVAAARRPRRVGCTIVAYRSVGQAEPRARSAPGRRSCAGCRRRPRRRASGAGRRPASSAAEDRQPGPAIVPCSAGSSSRKPSSRQVGRDRVDRRTAAAVSRAKPPAPDDRRGRVTGRPACAARATTRSWSASVSAWCSGRISESRVSRSVTGSGAVRDVGVGGLQVRGHDAAPGRDARVGQRGQQLVAARPNSGSSSTQNDW